MLQLSERIAVLALAVALGAPLAAQTTLYSYYGTNSVDKFGYSVRTVGDVDQDGYADFIFSAPFADTGGLDKNGFAEVRSGHTGGLIYRYEGPRSGDEFGYVCSGAGDVDGDGVPDFVIGLLIGQRRFQGECSIYSGATGLPIWTFSGSRGYDYFGLSASGVGDVDADGFDDVAVGAPGKDDNGSSSGEVKIFSGRDGTEIRSIDGDTSGDQFGWFLSDAGDVNCDKFPDMIVGAPTADLPGRTDCGMARVISGKDGAILHTFYGDGTDDHFGWCVSGAGDVDRDGYSDLIVGAYRNSQNGTHAGMARVYSGQTGAVLYTWLGGAAGDELGWSVRDAGDVDADGHGDVLVGARYDDTAHLDAGKAVLYSGATGQPIATFLGATVGAQMGFSVGGAGDVDADGYADIILGAAFDSTPGTDAGGAFVISIGGTGNPPKIEYREAGCPGSNGRLPRLEVRGRGALGESYDVLLRGGLASTPAVLNLGLQWDLPLGSLAPGCVAYAYPLDLFGTNTDLDGIASVTPYSTLPVNPAFLGVEIHHQWMVVDPTNNPLGISASNDAKVTLGQ